MLQRIAQREFLYAYSFNPKFHKQSEAFLALFCQKITKSGQEPLIVAPYKASLNIAGVLSTRLGTPVCGVTASRTDLFRSIATQPPSLEKSSKIETMLPFVPHV